MIVVGRVEAVRAATAQTGPGRRVSEHDAAWQEAVILVESAMKGGQAGQRVVVRFPGSLDVAWRATPRFTTGQEGTFLLRQDTISGSPNAMIAGPVPAVTPGFPGRPSKPLFRRPRLTAGRSGPQSIAARSR